MPETSPIFLDVDGLQVFSGRRRLVGPISFGASTGAPTWIIGENGAGKSTLIRALALRCSATGVITASIPLDLRSLTYYAPEMRAPSFSTLEQWRAALCKLAPAAIDPDVDALLPEISARLQLTTLSTGEEKRVVLWSLLRVTRPFTFLDEPFEHLSPVGKQTLMQILLRHAKSRVVVVATNQDVPPGAHVVEVR